VDITGPPNGIARNDENPAAAAPVYVVVRPYGEESLPVAKAERMAIAFREDFAWSFGSSFIGSM
jgi:hypothetical protein